VFASDYLEQAVEDLQLCIDVVAAPLQTAAGSITESLLGGGTLWCLAFECDRALAEFTADRLMFAVGGDRPALPAIALVAGATPALDQSPWRDARALVQEGDSVLCIDTSPSGDALALAISALGERQGSRLLGLSHTGIRDIDSAGEYTIIALPDTSRDRLLGYQALVLNCLCRLIEQQLFGD
jgi:D-sedoheptulose 7-phosphate isomerase